MTTKRLNIEIISIVWISINKPSYTRVIKYVEVLVIGEKHSKRFILRKFTLDTRSCTTSLIRRLVPEPL
jgi:hypothetical protein